MKKLILTFSMLVVLSASPFAALTLKTDVTSLTLSFLATDYNAATGAATITRTSGNTLTITSSTGQGAWHVTAQALAATFGFTPSAGDANPNKPSSDLSIRQPAYTTTYTAVTTTPFTLVSGTKGSNLARPVDYQLKSNLATDPPGTYTISIRYTLTSP